MFQRFIEVRSRYVGLHHWPMAPDVVSFLRSSHRHVFHVDLKIGVKHNERELEFTLVKRWLDALVPSFGESSTDDGCAPPINFGPKSCETIAEQIIRHALKKYGIRYIECAVFEDGENGGRVIYDGK